MSRYDIAIVGMGCVLPRASNLSQYWENIKTGEPYFKDMPEEIWHLRNFYSPDKSRNEKSYTLKGSFIEGFEFPFLDYKLPPNAMRGVDPTQLVTLEATRDALRDAGIEPRSAVLDQAVTIIGNSGVDAFAHSTVYLRRHGYLKRLRPLLEARGVSAQVIDRLFEQFNGDLARRGHIWNPSVAAVGAIASSVSNRVAQVFGVKGYNMTVDAACASSFVALDTACQALMAGDARVAIAGGADLGTNPAIYIGFSRVDGLSTVGMANPFDHTADGLVIGEGVGVIIVKRLEDALADGDRIRAVIRGIGSSSDGAGQAIYAPSVDGRARALRNALEVAETAADDVQYIEAHATSTVVGDANEYDAISTVYGNGRDPSDPLRLGSVKGQIGHLKAAAGMAGLIKTVLAMQHETLPHMPRFSKLTPHAEKPSRALLVPTELAPWPLRPDGKRIAAVTTSGFGGVNYHAIIEQGPEYSPPAERPEIPREVAIVGVTCRVAGADDPQMFWDNVTAGVDTFTRAVPEELHWEDHLDAAPKNERITTRVISKLDKYEINLLRHKIFPNAVSQISPTQFLGLDLADRVLEGAGFELREPKKIGVSIGSMHDDYFPQIFEPMVVDEWTDTITHCEIAREIDGAALADCTARVREALMEVNPPVTEHTLPGWMTNVTAGRMANKLNLHGPNFTVDTACSSGIAALVPAIYQLMFGHVEMMITGGLNQQLSDVFTCGVCALGAVAEEIPRPFDADGKGFLIGEGGVVFLIKRLDKARRDGDRIFAVINAVHGSSEADSKSMVAPSLTAISRSIRNTVSRSAVKERDIVVVDTHGSANLVSDLVEAQAVARELRPTPNGGPVQLTAIKSHIGHLYGGSGAASLLSAIQSLRSGQVPGIRNLRTTRPEIEELVDRVQPRHGTERIESKGRAAAANSLGLGGANYFAVVSVPEQADQARVAQGPRPGLSAGGFGEHTSMRAGDEDVRDVFVGLVEGEEHLSGAIGRALSKRPIPEVITHGNRVGTRLAVTFESQEALRTKLGAALKMLDGGHALAPLESQGVFVASVSDEGSAGERLAFCFPGQGTHYITMGRHLYDRHDGFRAIVDQVSGLALEAFDFDLKAHIYGDPEDETIKQRLGTLVGAQTALFAVEIGMAEVMRGLGVTPDVLIGHSFGEISALTAAGVWDLPTAFEVVKARIRAAEQIQQQDGPGLGMMSVICSAEQRDAILKLAGDSVVLTNINAPNRFVLSGERESVKRAVDLAESFGLDARLLPIGSAFHSRFMEPARAPFRAALEKLPCAPPAVPILSTITGEYVATEGFDSAYLAEHLSSQLVTPLNLPREVERLYAEGVQHFIEIGPGWSMTKMISGILGDRPHRAAPTLHPKVGDEETFRRARAFLMALGHMGSAAERRNVPGIFSPDFIAYMEQHEPAVLGLIEEVHQRFVAALTEQASEVSRPPRAAVRPAAPPSPREATAPSTPPTPPQAPAAQVAAGASDWIGRVREKLMATTGYPADMLQDDLDLEADLGVDSVQRAEIWISLTGEHGLDTEARPTGIRTIAQFAQALSELAGGDSVPAPAATPAAAPQPATTEPARPSAADVTAQWIERVREKLVATTGYPADMLGSDLDLEADLGVDSVQRAEIWISLTTEHGLDTEVRPSGIRTIAQFAQALADMAGSGTPGDEPPAAAGEAATPAPAADAGGEIWVERVRQKLVKTTGYPAEMLEIELDLEADLGVDSVQRAEIWISLTTEHGLDTEVRPSGIRTIAQFSRALAELAGSGELSGQDLPAAVAKADEAPRPQRGDEDCQLFASCYAAMTEDEVVPFECRRILAVVDGEDALSAAVEARLASQGIGLASITPGAVERLGNGDAATALAGCDTLVYLAHHRLGGVGDDGEELGRALQHETRRLFSVFRRLGPALDEAGLRVIVPVAGDGAFGAASDGPRPLLGSFPAGFVRCLDRELPRCKVMLVDTGLVPWDEAVERCVDVTTRRLESGLDRHGRLVPNLYRVARSTVREYPVGRGELVLVTGGARGIVFECVSALARESGCKLLLTGRTPLPEGEPEWLAASPDEIDRAIRELEIGLVRGKGIGLGEAKRIGARSRAQWEVKRNLDRLEREGSSASYRVCDVTDRDALSSLIREVAAVEPIRGVVHGAGIQRSKLIAELDDEAVALTVGTKLLPVYTMLDTLDFESLRMFSAFGSIAGLFGNIGQSDYGLANDLLTWTVRAIKARFPHVAAQTVEWTAWSGTGMVRDEEAQRFAEAGLTLLDARSGTELYLEGLGGTAHAQLAAFNPGAAFAAGRPLAEHAVAARPSRHLISVDGGARDRARFSLERDVYLYQHLVNGEPVVPGTFVSDIFAEATSDTGQIPREIRFRRPLRVVDGEIEVEIVRQGDRLLALPADRPALGDKGTANLAFATCRVAAPEVGQSADLTFAAEHLEQLRAAMRNGGASFYARLDRDFSHALKTGGVFRGIRSTVEIDQRFYGLVTLTEEAARSFEIPGEFVFNPVLADMAVQVAVAWSMQRQDVMGIPFGIDSLHVAGKTRQRDAVVVCREVEMKPDQAVVDLSVRELDGRLVLSMDRLTLKTIARLD